LPPQAAIHSLLRVASLRKDRPMSIKFEWHADKAEANWRKHCFLVRTSCLGIS